MSVQSQRPLFERIRKVVLSIATLSLFIGVVLILVGMVIQAIFPEDLYKRLAKLCLFVITMGSATVGAAISLMLDEFKKASDGDDIRSLLQKMLAFGITSNETSIEPYRKQWYHYFLTRVKIGNVIHYEWRARVFDFVSPEHSPGKLVTSITAKNDQGNFEPFTVQAGRLRERFIIICSPDKPTSDKPAVEIYPFADNVEGEGGRYGYFGIGIEFTWSKTEILYPCFLTLQEIKSDSDESIFDSSNSMGPRTKKSLHKSSQQLTFETKTVHKDHEQLLYARWEEHFTKRIHIPDELFDIFARQERHRHRSYSDPLHREEKDRMENDEVAASEQP
jgi:hypothetical protein